jgi:MFS family permease
MVGFGETYIPAFALALGMGEIASGLVATLPMFLGGVLQAAAPYGAYLLRSRRRWVVASAAAQALAFVPLAVGAACGRTPAWIVFAAVGLYWAAGLSTGAVWNAWIETLVPPRLRATFFARRSRLAQFSLVGGVLLGGWLLEVAARAGAVLWAFALIFTLAGVGRAVSTHALWRQREPVKPDCSRPPISLLRTIRELSRSPARRFFGLCWFVQASVYVSGPFFNAYMLVRLELTYADYLVLIATAFLAKIVAFSHLGAVARRIGVRRLFFIGAATIVPLPALWLGCGDFWFLALIQTLSGVGWAFYELGMFLLLFEETPPQRRAEWLTVFHAGLTAATAAGSLLGAALMRIPTDPAAGYAIVFFASSAGRLLALPLHRRRGASPLRATTFEPVDSEPPPAARTVASGSRG